MVTLDWIAPLSPHRSRRGLTIREIRKENFISNLKSLGALDPSRIVPMEFAHDAMFYFPAFLQPFLEIRLEKAEN